MLQDRIRDNLSEAQEVLSEFIQDPKSIASIENALQILIECINQGGAIYSCGNGGSFCDAMHFAEELTGKFRENRKSLRAMAISDASHLSCVANDFGYNHVFSRFLEGWAKPGDVLLGISTSGNSANVIEAVKTAKKLGMKSIGLLGKTGGDLKNLVDSAVIVKGHVWADRIQEVHIKIIHILIDGIEQGLK